MSSIAIVGDVVEHAVITDAECTNEGDGSAFNKAAIKLLAAFNEVVGKQDVRLAVDYHLVLVAETPEEPVKVVDRSERARRPTEMMMMRKPSGKGECGDGTCPGVRWKPNTTDPSKPGFTGEVDGNVAALGTTGVVGASCPPDSKSSDDGSGGA